MSFDPTGLGLGIGFGGFGEGFTATGFHSLAGGGSVTQLNRFADSASRRKLQAEIISFLSLNRGPRTFKEIAESSINIDLSTDECKKILEDLGKNSKIILNLSDKIIQYKPYFLKIDSIQEILILLIRSPHGQSEENIRDCYIGADKDIEELIQRGDLLRFYYDEKKANEKIGGRLFARFRNAEITIDEDVKKLWGNVKMPSTVTDIEDELFKEGHMSERQRKLAQIDQARRATEELKRRQSSSTSDVIKRSKKRMRITNTHLIGEVDFLKSYGK